MLCFECSHQKFFHLASRAHVLTVLLSSAVSRDPVGIRSVPVGMGKKKNFIRLFIAVSERESANKSKFEES